MIPFFYSVQNLCMLSNVFFCVCVCVVVKLLSVRWDLVSGTLREGLL